MRFHCPACGFDGGVRIPAHLPKGKTVRIRCSRCRETFPLSLGKLFPQEQSESYQILAADALGCHGIKVGRLWIESNGVQDDRSPVLVLPTHPALSHDVMHDLADPFAEYFRICYLEFPGTRRNPRDPEKQSYTSLFSDHIDLVKRHLGVSRFHLLAHLGSAALALDVAVHHPDSVASLIFIEPDFSLADPCSNRSACKKLDSMIRAAQGDADREELLATLLQDVWGSNLPQSHARGLAKIFAPGFQPGNLHNKLSEPRNVLRYRKLSRQRTPVLILHARDGSDTARKDAFYLQATLSAAETESVERGAAWAAWFHGAKFSEKILSFKRRMQGKDKTIPRKRSQTLNGQPLGWMVLLFTILAAGLALGSNFLRFQPGFMSGVLPALIAGLLPILWFLIPKKINPIAFLRFSRFSVRTVLLPLAVGALLGVFFRSLLLTLGEVALPGFVPSSLLSLPPGSQGRLFQLVSMAVAGLFVFGMAENLWVLRRSRLQVLLPTLLFTLFPPAFPDVFWRLPMGFAAAILFAASLSIYSPLFLLTAFTAASEAPIPFEKLPVAWQSVQGVAVTTALLAAAVLLAVFLGTGGKGVPPEETYFTNTINRDDRLFRWATNLGIILVIFSIIAAIGLIFGLIEI